MVILMEKITKTSNIIKTILKILFWISAVVSVVSLVAILIALFANGDATKVDNLSITLGSYSLLLNQEYSTSRHSLFAYAKRTHHLEKKQKKLKML